MCDAATAFRAAAAPSPAGVAPAACAGRAPAALSATVGGAGDGSAIGGVEVVVPARPRRVQGAAGGGGQGMWAARRVHGGMQTHPAFKTHPPVVVATRDQRLAGGELVQ